MGASSLDGPGFGYLLGLERGSSGGIGVQGVRQEAGICKAREAWIWEAREGQGVVHIKVVCLEFVGVFGPDRKGSNRLAHVKRGFCLAREEGRAMFTFGQGAVRARDHDQWDY